MIQKTEIKMGQQGQDKVKQNEGHGRELRRHLEINGKTQFLDDQHESKVKYSISSFPYAHPQST
jgi:hypothetical protein